MSYYSHHVFFCCNQRQNGDACCNDHGANDVRDYAKILHDLAVRRSLIRIGEDIVNTAYEAPTEKGPQAQIEEAELAWLEASEKLEAAESA